MQILREDAHDQYCSAGSLKAGRQEWTETRMNTAFLTQCLCVLSATALDPDPACVSIFNFDTVPLVTATMSHIQGNKRAGRREGKQERECP